MRLICFTCGKGIVVKVLSTDKIGQDIVELCGAQAKEMKRELLEVVR